MKKILQTLTVVASVAISNIAAAIDWSAYSHDGDIGYRNSAWMAQIPSDRPISQISMVGTHDTMALYGGDSVQTQSMSLNMQLQSGIRALDIRCRHYYNSCAIHHGFVYQNANLDDVFTTLQQFLQANPSETVLMRVKEEYDPVGNTRSFEDTFAAYAQRYPNLLWQSNSANPSLGQVRGKAVVLQNFSGYQSWGIYYNSLNIQDDYNVTTNWDLYSKWTKVKNQLANASQGAYGTIYMNYLSASGGSFPYFIASGNSSPQTGAPLLSTGLTTPGFKSSYPEFPRVACFIGICTIAFEGTNRLASERLAGTTYGRVGILMTDFPGKQLIQNVISHNFR